MKSRPCILQGGDTKAQLVRKYIIGKKYVDSRKLICDTVSHHQYSAPAPHD